MRKKNSSIPGVVSMIKIDISGDLKYSVNESNNVYLFSYNNAMAFSFFRTLFVTLLWPLIFIHLILLLCLSWFPMTSLSCDCHVTQKHAVIHLSPDL